MQKKIIITLEITEPIRCLKCKKRGESNDLYKIDIMHA